MTLEDLIAIARNNCPIVLTKQSEDLINNSRKLIEKWSHDGKIIYGVTTGFGALSDVIISKNDIRQLRENILKSHAAGVGNPLDKETVMAIMALRIKDLARGNSCIRLETVKHLITLLNMGIYPVIPEKGSVGASGDLSPLAHLSLILIWMGEAYYNGEKMSGREALRKCDLKPIQLEASEGLPRLGQR